MIKKVVMIILKSLIHKRSFREQLPYLIDATNERKEAGTSFCQKFANLFYYI